jgi:radical SAM protein with 4Fe4S-binding SPASM domain
MLLSINELRKHQGEGATDIISTLRNVEISAIDICNRKCGFCPRSSDIYINKKEQASLLMIEKIAIELNSIKFNGRVSFVGFGEPLLYKNLTNAISIIKNLTPTVQWIEVITNGDYLTINKIKELEKAGCTNMIVSMYDDDISEKLIKLFENVNITLTLKDCYNGLSVVNRTDIMTQNKPLNIKRPCYLPFYKMIIDSNGDVIICSNDWGRLGVIGNVLKNSIQEIWLGDIIENYRKELQNGHRKNCEPCKYCDINGIAFGEESFQVWGTHARTTD